MSEYQYAIDKANELRDSWMRKPEIRDAASSYVALVVSTRVEGKEWSFCVQLYKEERTFVERLIDEGIVKLRRRCIQGRVRELEAALLEIARLVLPAGNTHVGRVAAAVLSREEP